MNAPPAFKNLLWLIYKRTGVLHALLIRLQLIRLHGLRQGNLSFRKLPPGDLHPLDRLISSDQATLLGRSNVLGSVFKFKTRRQLIIAISDLRTARRLISEHGESLQTHHKDLDAIFPIGHLRGMRGATHRHYRQLFVRAIRPELIDACTHDLRDILRHELAALSPPSSTARLSTDRLIVGMREMTTKMLLRILFGLRTVDAMTQPMLDAFANFSDGYAPARDFYPKQHVFASIRDLVTQQIDVLFNTPSPIRVQCVLGSLSSQETLDDTTLGNLIYMVEAGRFDVFSLFRWIVYYLAHAPNMTAKVDRERSEHGGSDDLHFAKAVVLETLRLNQSEAIQRQLSRDLWFDHFFFPAGSQIRFCLWEAHKRDDPFECPMHFHPDRFVQHDYSIDQYAPFGLDQHRCIAADIVVMMATLFVDELARHEIKIGNDDNITFGAYHWEPGQAFSIEFGPRR